MSETLTCRRCGSTEVVPNVSVTNRDSGSRYGFEVEVQRKPNAKLFKGAVSSRVTAQMCAACGHLEFFADKPKELYAAHRQADANPDISVLEELERTREALAESQLQLQELETKLAFVEQLLEPKPSKSLPRSPDE